MATGRLGRIALLTLGWVLVGVGIVGLALPFLQGVFMILAGLAILSRESRWVRYHVTRYRRRHPALDRRMHEVGAWLRRAVPARWRSPEAGDQPGSREPAGEGVADDDDEWQNVPTDGAKE